VKNQACLRQGIVDGSQILSVDDDLRWECKRRLLPTGMSPAWYREVAAGKFTNPIVTEYVKATKLPITMSFKCPPTGGFIQVFEDILKNKYEDFLVINDKVMLRLAQDVDRKNNSRSIIFTDIEHESAKKQCNAFTDYLNYLKEEKERRARRRLTTRPKSHSVVLEALLEEINQLN